MKLVDSNVWLALALSRHQFHESARTWIEGEKEEGGLCFCRLTQLSFLRLLTTSVVLEAYGNPPLSSGEAWQVFEGYLSDRRICFADEPPGLEETWKGLAATETASPKAWMDAYLAAFAIQGGFQLVSTDKAFLNYNGLDALLLANG